MRALLAGILIGWLVLPASATDYYIDFSGGSDSNDGLSTGSAWKRLPFDPADTGTAQSHTPVAGNRYLLRRGVTYLGTNMIIDVSGTVANPIVIDGDSWGTGSKAILSNARRENGNIFQTSGTRSNYVFQNLHFKDYGGIPDGDSRYSGAFGSYSSVIGGSAFRSDVPSYNMHFRFNDFEHGGYVSNSTVNFDGEVITGHAIRLIGGSGHRIETNTFFAIGTPIALQDGVGGVPLTNVIVRDNVFGRTNIANPQEWAIDVAMARQGGKIGHILFQNNKVWSPHVFDNANWAGGRNGTPSGSGDNPHSNGIFFRNPVGFHVNTEWIMTNGVPTVVVDGFEFTSDWGPEGSGTGAIFISQGPSVMIRNSKFGNVEMGNGNIVIAHPPNVSTQRVYIIHNTFSQNARISNNSENFTRRKVIVANNIFHVASGSANAIAMTQHFDGGSGLSMIEFCDNNIYYNPTLSSTTWNAVKNGSTYYRLSSWQSFSGFDVNSLFVDPAFTDYIFDSGTESDLSVLATSAAIGRGTNFNHLAPLDRNGVTRANPPTIGAYEFVDEEPEEDTDPPEPATMLWVTPPQLTGPQSITMTWTNASDASLFSYDLVETTGNPGCPASTIVDSMTDTFTAEGLPYETTCAFKVRAVDIYGNTNAYTETLEVTTAAQPAALSMIVTNLTVANLTVNVPITNLFYLNAEFAGTPPGWTNIGTINWDDNFATRAGTNSFAAESTNIASYTSTKFTATTNLDAIIWLRRSAIGATKRTLAWFGNDGTATAGVMLGNTGASIFSGTVTNDIPFTATSAQWYAVYLSLQTGSGANALVSAIIHTNSNFGESTWTGSIANGTVTTSFNQVFFGHIGVNQIGTIRYDECWARTGYQQLTLENPEP